MTDPRAVAAVLAEIDRSATDLIGFAADLIRIPTVNPPGESYRECADAVGEHMESLGFDVEYHVADNRPEHTARHPRVNVVGSLSTEGAEAAARPCMHFNGHFDVVPPGEGWTFDPFCGDVLDGRLRGRGSADMKSGLAAAVYAASALRRAGVPMGGTVEVSATVDEESGGFAGVAHLAEVGRIAKDRTDLVIIPEPFGVARISVGHRGVYWYKVTALGRTGHGSMPFLGRSAIDDLAHVLSATRDQLAPEMAKRTTVMPVVPATARHGSVNVNSIVGGQADANSAGGALGQTPCVADVAEAVFDRRFLLEEGFDAVRGEVEGMLERLQSEDPERHYVLEDLMVVHPTQAPPDSPLTIALERAIEEIVGTRAERVASPGTYDQKHVTRIAGIEHCVAYGPGELEQAHQPDESCSVADIITASKVLAVATLDLLEGAP